ncbi:hypothetical protein EV424DRAFT_1458202, partial [Suillus variegatus]
MILHRLFTAPTCSLVVLTLSHPLHHVLIHRLSCHLCHVRPGIAAFSHLISLASSAAQFQARGSLTFSPHLMKAATDVELRSRALLILIPAPQILISSHHTC